MLKFTNKMKKRLLGSLIVILMSTTILSAQKIKSFEIKSFDGNITLNVETGAKLQWSVKSAEQQIIAPSAISLQLESGEILGGNVKILSSKTEKADNVLAPFNYKKSAITDQYNQLTINFKGDFGINSGCIMKELPTGFPQRKRVNC